MHKLLEEKLATEKADPTFEQRMLSGFRRRIPDNRGGLARFLVNALRSRVTQIAAAAVVLLALVQTGRVITHEDASAVFTNPVTRQFATASSDELDRKDIARDALKPEARAKVSGMNSVAQTGSMQDAQQFARNAPPAETQPGISRRTTSCAG